MTAVRRIAALAGTAIFALAVLPVATATPAAADTCSPQRVKGTTDGVKISYTVCTRSNSGVVQKKVYGRLSDTKENGYNACAEIAFTYKTLGYFTGSSMPYDTGWQDGGGNPKISLYNC